MDCPWDFPGKNTREGCHFLLFPTQGIFPTQGSHSHLLLGRRILYHWATREAKAVVSNTRIWTAWETHFLPSFTSWEESWLSSLENKLIPTAGLQRLSLSSKATSMTRELLLLCNHIDVPRHMHGAFSPRAAAIVDMDLHAWPKPREESSKDCVHASTCPLINCSPSKTLIITALCSVSIPWEWSLALKRLNWQWKHAQRWKYHVNYDYTLPFQLCTKQICFYLYKIDSNNQWLERVSWNQKAYRRAEWICSLKFCNTWKVCFRPEPTVGLSSLEG